MEEKQITLQIDGHFITVPEGSTILEAACKIGINIPTLCHIDLKGTCIKNNPASCRRKPFVTKTPPLPAVSA